MACTEKLNVYLANLAVWNIKLHKKARRKPIN